ncbi:hypothetical protein CWC38_08780 [Kocuria tytonicola]|uniref:FtsK/SpoIIIE domain-containing protein n=1 Tax=Kocuria tytonicola TaxID=2055946 RepID=UPI000EF8D896|nr:FtsK/SpoIIIE domain-containing protein [Kocuria tytonicola]RLZ02878.1 hypothetical protein CWC38_08780 [Kocuria tytonicola]
MQLSLHVLRHGAGTTHPVSVTASPGTSGEDLAAELARQLGTEHRATVAGVDLGRATVGAPPLTDGATVVLHPVVAGGVPVSRRGSTRDPGQPVASGRSASSCGAPSSGGAARSAVAPLPGAVAPVGGSPTEDGPREADAHDVVRLTVVEGAGAGTELVLPRGRHRVVLDGGGPVLSRVETTSGIGLVVDGSGVRVLPSGTALSHGDRLRLSLGDEVSWLRVERHGERSEARWPDPAATPAGFSTHEAAPDHELPLEPAHCARAAVAMVTGLLPLCAGVAIALVTHWWFFLLFSALGAVTSAAGWVADRGARAEQRRRLAAARERDLRRCDHAAPPVAELVARCRALPPERGPDTGSPGSEALRWAAAAPAGGPRSATSWTQHRTAATSGDTGSAVTARWVRLGQGTRAAVVGRGRGIPVRAVTHRRAPVLVDLARVRVLTLAVTGECSRGLLNALAVQLFTGPQALDRLTVSPDVAWAPPPALARLLQSPASPSPPGSTRDAARPGPTDVTGLEVLTPQDAALAAAAPGVVRVVLAGGAAPGPQDTLVSEVRGGLRLSTPSCDAVPGLSAQEQRTSLDFVPDTVSDGTAHLALQAWTAAAARRPSRRRGALPRAVASHELLLADDERPDPTTVGPGSEQVSTGLPPRAHSPLGTVIGVSRDGRERIVLDDENPHLLIAGTTGCGKSEVLRTLVAGLARGADPGRLEFLLVDFKGGAALAPLADLPHVSTLLTDLGPDEVRRALVFLHSELQRRERVLRAHGLDTMAQVLQRGGTPVVRELVVVVDEAKMLTDSFPEAAHQLAVVATVGRSLGVHLVLATQRPQGALPPDVRANVSQALCLRVRTEQESLDMIGSGLAAGIPPNLPGRGYLDRGHGAPVEVQCAVLTRLCTPPPAPLQLRFLPAARPHDGAPGAFRPAPAPDPGAAVRDVRRFWESPGAVDPRDPASGDCPDPGDRAVPPGLPRCASPERVPFPLVDLGPAENPAEHWCGRLTWDPWEDGPLALIGRPSAVRSGLRSLVERCAAASPEEHAAPGVALYVVSATGAGTTDLTGPTDAGCANPLRGTAHADHPADLAHLLDRLRCHLESTPDDPEGGHERALVVVADWDRCCQLLRAGAWAHLEDDLLSLLAVGPSRGLSAVLTGDRSLMSGRGAHSAPNRVLLPAGQTPEALLQWPRLPPFSGWDSRGAVSGPVTRSCGDPGGPPRADRLVVVQLAAGEPVDGYAPLRQEAADEGVLGQRTLWRSDQHGGSKAQGAAGFSVTRPAGDAVLRTAALRSSRGSRSSRELIGGPRSGLHGWPVAFPLPSAWSSPAEVTPGLLLGVTREGDPAVHPWGPGATLLVAGPARSGRTSFLAAARAHLSTALTTDEARAAHHVVSAAPGSADDVQALLRSLERSGRPVTLLVDDADRLSPEVLRALATAWSPGSPRHTASKGNGSGHDCDALAPGVRLVVGTRLTDSLLSTFPPLMAWRQQADTLLLRPRRAFDGEAFGVSLAGQGLGGPPGRGFWVHRGTVEPVQAPLPPTSPAPPAVLDGTGPQQGV